jgi:hypothetical protein
LRIYAFETQKPIYGFFYFSLVTSLHENEQKPSTNEARVERGGGRVETSWDGRIWTSISL